MRVAWATDIHIDSAGPGGLDLFVARVRAVEPEALLLTGDISHAQRLVDDLSALERALALPILFVLGNHDYYGGSVAEVRAAVGALRGPHLHWMNTVGVVPLSSSVLAVGHDGWADGRLGNFADSQVLLTDDVAIDELRGAGAPPGMARQVDRLWGWEHKRDLARVLAELGDEAAASLRPHLAAALDSSPNVVVLTHVPPFRGASWHQGALSGDDFLPRFTCHAMGELLLEQAARHPGTQVTVLCGHTHGSGEYRPLPNLLVRTGGAEYGNPRAESIELPD